MNKNEFLGKKFDKNLVLDNIKNTFVSKSKIHGNGLFASKKIKTESLLCLLDGQYLKYDFLVKIQEFYKNKKHIDNNKSSNISLEWNALTKDILLVRFYSTKYGFINHSPVPNVKIVKNPLKLISIKDIEEGEELLLDYREESLNEEYLLNHGIKYL